MFLKYKNKTMLTIFLKYTSHHYCNIILTAVDEIRHLLIKSQCPQRSP